MKNVSTKTRSELIAELDELATGNTLGMMRRCHESRHYRKPPNSIIGDEPSDRELRQALGLALIESQKGPVAIDQADVIKSCHTSGKLRVTMFRELATEDNAVIARPVYDMRHDSEKNFARLAACWNTHDELVEALELVVNDAENNEDSKIEPYIINAARAALAKAKGE